MILVDDDHARQLGDASARAAQVQRPDVDERLLDRNHHQRAPGDLRSLLIPQRDLRRNHLVLVDARHHLTRTEDHLLLRELEHAHVAVVRRVAARDEPRRQVVLAPRRERKHLDELRVGLAGQPHDRVVRLHRGRGLARVVDGGDLPLVFAVVEDGGLRHVIRREHRRLHPEQILGIADMRPQRGRHLAERLEHPRKHIRVGREHRILRIRRIERRRAVEGVDDDLHGVADVVHASHRWRRIGIPIARGVGVVHPEQMSIRQHDVRIAIEGQERRNLADALRDVAVEENPAVGGDVVVERDLIRAEAQREHEPSAERFEREAAAARVLREDVLVAARVVELARPRVDDDVVVRQLAEVEARFLNGQLRHRFRRQVAHVQHRKPFAGHLRDRPERQAVAVRERQALVDPRAVGKAVRVQLARGEHDLLRAAVDHVAVVVHRHEVVVRADLLQLAEGVEQRLAVPQPHVLQRRRVTGDVLARERGVAGEGVLLDVVESEGAARRLDVVLDERRLANLLVRRDDEALEQRRVSFAADVHDQIEGNRHRDRPVPTGERLQHRQQDAGDGDRRERERHRHPRVHIGVRRAVDDSCRMNQQLEASQPRAEREQHEEDGNEQRQVPPDVRRHRHEGRRPRDHAAGHEIQRARAKRRHDDERLADAANQLQERNREDVERHVASEDRIRLAERNGLLPRHPGFPLRRGIQPDQARQNHRDCRGDRSQLLTPGERHLHALLRGEDRPALTDRAERHSQVDDEPEDRDDEHGREQRRLAAHDGREDLLIADFTEPEPVRVEADERGPAEEQHGEHDQRDVAKGVAHG